MRVLHVLEELRPSGAETMLVTAAPHFARLGVRTHVLSTGAARGVYAETMADAGFGVHHLPHARTPDHFRAFARLVRGGRFDAVHLHREGACELYALAAAGAASLVWTAHSVFPYTGRLRAVKTAQRALLRATGCRSVSIGPTVRDTERRLLRHPTELIRNWYDPQRFRVDPSRRAAVRAALGLGDAPTLVMIGNVSPIKNQTAALEAVALLPEARDLRVVHAGEDPQGVLPALAERLGLRDRLHALGFRRDAPDLLNAADLFVMPSRLEGVGIAAIEAFACGVPAVLSRAGGLKDFAALTDDVIYADPDPADLARALRAALALPPDERARRGRRLAEVARAHFSPAEGVHAYVSLYRSPRRVRAA